MKFDTQRSTNMQQSLGAMEHNICSRDPRLQMRNNGLSAPQAEHTPTSAAAPCSASDMPHDPLRSYSVPPLPASVPWPPCAPLSNQLDADAARTPPSTLPADTATEAAQAGPTAHGKGPQAAATHAASIEQQANIHAADAPMLQPPANVDASSLGTASTTCSAGISVPDASLPPPADTAASAVANLQPATDHAASQPPPVDPAASAGAGWQPTADQDHPPTYIKLHDVSKRAAVPKRIMGIPFGGKDSIPAFLALLLAAPGGLWLGHIERRTHDGLDIPKRMRDVLQLDCPQAAGQDTFVVLQRMTYGGEVKPAVLGVRYLAAGEVTPEIEQAAAQNAQSSSPQRQQQGGRAPKRHRKASVCPQTGRKLKRHKKASLQAMSAGPKVQMGSAAQHAASANAAAMPYGAPSPSALPLVASALEGISWMCSSAP